jgi:hypothetical protein
MTHPDLTYLCLRLSHHGDHREPLRAVLTLKQNCNTPGLLMGSMYVVTLRRVASLWSSQSNSLLELRPQGYNADNQPSTELLFS